MAEVRTRDEALAATGQALGRWLSNAAGVLVQAAAAAEGAVDAAEREVRHKASQVSALNALLKAPHDEHESRALHAKLREAQGAHRVACQAAQQIAAIRSRVNALQRSHAQSAEATVSAARADLLRRASELGSYRSVGGGGGGGASAGSPGPSGGGGSWMSSMGLSSIDVGSVDFSDNPIQGEFGRGGATRADYRWAVQTWDEIVGPGVEKGMTRDDFVARDTARGAPPRRRSADVYDMFTGDDRIRLSRRVDGSFDVIGGRHRLAVARELGIKSLPGQVFE